jgi:hypothetical protein
MKKRTIPFLLVCVLLLAVAVSCNSNPGGGGSDTPKMPPELTLSNFKQYYPVGAQTSDLIGTLYYKEDGKITTLSVKDEGVTISGFDSSAVAENKTIKFTYKNLDCVATYSIAKKAEVHLEGTVIFDKYTTYTFKNGSNEVTKEVYKSWYDYYNCGVEGAEDPVVSKLTYTVDINTSGATIIRFEDDSWPYRPDGKGGLNGKPSDADYFYDNAPQPYFYVSATAEDTRMVTNPIARGKYLVMAFDFYGNMYMWFTENTDEATLKALKATDAIMLSGKMIAFDSIGVYFDNVTAHETKAKNLRLMIKDGYGSKDRAFSLVSSSGDGYYGYSYNMKLTDIEPNWN